MSEKLSPLSKIWRGPVVWTIVLLALAYLWCQSGFEVRTVTLFGPGGQANVICLSPGKLDLLITRQSLGHTRAWSVLYTRTDDGSIATGPAFWWGRRGTKARVPFQQWPVSFAGRMTALYVSSVPPDGHTFAGLGYGTFPTNERAAENDAVMIGTPMWFWTLFALSMLIRATFRSLRTGRRHRLGHCLVCGYDLRATPGRCPECGTVEVEKAGRSIVSRARSKRSRGGAYCVRG